MAYFQMSMMPKRFAHLQVEQHKCPNSSQLTNYFMKNKI